MLELERDLQLDHHIPVLRERDTVRDVSYELGVLKLSDNAILLGYELGLAFAVG
jgi:hypothetical protein